MNNRLPINTIKVLAPPGLSTLNPRSKIPPHLVFDVWSGQHRIAAAKQFLRGELVRDSVGVVVPVNAELDHQQAFWFAEVYKRGKFYLFFILKVLICSPLDIFEENKELFHTLVVADNHTPEGTLAPSFMDIWSTMRKVFGKEDLTPTDRLMHFKNMVPHEWEHMERVLGCESMCLVLDNLLRMPAYHAKPGKLNAAFKFWGTKGHRQVIVSFLCCWIAVANLLLIL
jgi:hypothetical protein